jgi:hypothetical protein
MLCSSASRTGSEHDLNGADIGKVMQKAVFHCRIINYGRDFSTVSVKLPRNLRIKAAYRPRMIPAGLPAAFQGAQCETSVIKYRYIHIYTGLNIIEYKLKTVHLKIKKLRTLQAFITVIICYVMRSLRPCAEWTHHERRRIPRYGCQTTETGAVLKKYLTICNKTTGNYYDVAIIMTVF